MMKFSNPKVRALRFTPVPTGGVDRVNEILYSNWFGEEVDYKTVTANGAVGTTKYRTCACAHLL